MPKPPRTRQDSLGRLGHYEVLQRLQEIDAADGLVVIVVVVVVGPRHRGGQLFHDGLREEGPHLRVGVEHLLDLATRVDVAAAHRVQVGGAPGRRRQLQGGEEQSFHGRRVAHECRISKRPVPYHATDGPKTPHAARVTREDHSGEDVRPSSARSAYSHVRA
jgi:hypothetical protein